ERAPRRLVVSHARYAMRVTDVVTPVPGAVVDVGPIALPAESVIEGAALDARGRPMVGARVSAELVEANQSIARRVGGAEETVAGDGRFELRRLDAGLWRVEVAVEAAKDVLIPKLRGEAHVAEGAVAHVDLQPISEGGCTIRGRITCAGRDVARATITVEVGGPTATPSNANDSIRRAVADDWGRFTVENVFAGSATLVVDALRDGRGWHYVQPLEVPDAPRLDLDVDLPTGGTIVGRVVRADDRQPVAGIAVRAHWPVDPDERPIVLHTSTSDSLGRYELRDVPGGKYRVYAAGEGIAYAPKFVEVVDGGTTTADLEVARPASVVVEVRAPDGSVAAGRRVTLEAPDAPSPEGIRPIGETGADGIARFGSIAPGKYVAVVLGDGSSPPGSLEPIVAEAGKETRAQIRLVRCRAVRVRADAASNWRLAVALDAGNRIVAVSPRDDGGSATLMLPQGKFTIAIEGERSGNAQVEISESGPEEVVVKVASPPGGERR
ncbi:MAG TPA: carboxypeptidase-like regulatory domain-containing protein, partial [Planctomycetota bacterium]|nr:carboxypeptidase-like regulatory domain-containing protein [Planctomycetota bacterium]